MSIQAATPYFILRGKAEKAIAFYQRALGAKVQTMQRFGDVDASCAEAMKSLVMHAELRVGSATLMMSDGPGEGSLPTEGVVSVALTLDDTAETRRCFDALAASGTVIQPIMDAPWGGLFGVTRDEFGVNWMFNCTTR